MQVRQFVLKWSWRSWNKKILYNITHTKWIFYIEAKIDKILTNIFWWFTEYVRFLHEQFIKNDKFSRSSSISNLKTLHCNLNILILWAQRKNSYSMYNKRKIILKNNRTAFLWSEINHCRVSISFDLC